MGEILLLTIEQAADRLGLGRSTVYQLIGRGEIPVVRIGRSVRIATQDLELFVRTQRVAAGAA